MASTATRSFYGLVRRRPCYAALTNGTTPPCQNRSLTRRHLHAIASSSSASPHPNTTEAVSDGTNVLNVVEEDVVSNTNIQGDPGHEAPSLFKSLNGRISHETLKALTVYPFQLKIMTPVQDRVTALLPDLVRHWDPEEIISLNSSNSSPPGSNDPRDILVRAKTGTGKTLAYIISAIESRLNQIEHHASLAIIKTGLESSSHVAERARLAYRRRSAGPLVLAPTRELAIQIASNAQKLTTHQRDFAVQLLVGGAGKARQMIDWMESSRDFVVATPGRLRDLLINEPEFRQGFKTCPLVVLDEADTLLSMGFRDDIDAIISFLPRPPTRQTFLFSATMPRAVRQLASWILSPNHTFVDAAPPEPGSASRQGPIAHGKHAVPCDHELTTHDHIEQFYTLCPTASDQLPTLLKLLAHDQLVHGSTSKTIVFCPTVQMTELYSTLLCSLAEEVLPEDTTEIVTMHSKMKQSDRDRARVLFRKMGTVQNRKPTILVSSDVSARGMDYPGVTRVVQLGIPSKETMYIHRIGRMARGANSSAPRKGKEDKTPFVRADLLLLPWESGYMKWQLTSLSIKPLTISVLDSQLASLSSTLTSESFKSAAEEIQSRVEPSDVRDTAASLLGYYLPLSPSLRLQPNAVLAGVSTWASECFNASLPPLTRYPRKFMEAYEQSTQMKTKGLFVDGLKVAGPSSLGKVKSKNRSVWEGADRRKKKPKRWY